MCECGRVRVREREYVSVCVCVCVCYLPSPPVRRRGWLHRRAQHVRGRRCDGQARAGGGQRRRVGTVGTPPPAPLGRTRVRWPALHARWRGVMPWLAAWLTSAPLFTSCGDGHRIPSGVGSDRGLRPAREGENGDAAWASCSPRPQSDAPSRCPAAAPCRRCARASEANRASTRSSSRLSLGMTSPFTFLPVGVSPRLRSSFSACRIL